MKSKKNSKYMSNSTQSVSLSNKTRESSENPMLQGPKTKKKFRTVGIWPEGRKLPISACDLKQMGVRNRKSQPKPPWSDMKTMKNKYSRAYVIE